MLVVYEEGVGVNEGEWLGEVVGEVGGWCLYFWLGLIRGWVVVFFIKMGVLEGRIGGEEGGFRYG